MEEMMRDRRYVVVFDVGTGSGRCLIFDFQGRELAECHREWTPQTLPQYPGSRDFDTRASWLLLKECLRDALKCSGIRPEEIAGVTGTSMREGFVLYDLRGREIWGCPNTDARAGEEGRELIEQGVGEKVFQEGGDWFAIHAMPRLVWIRKKQPDIFHRARHLTMLGDWVVYKLTGEYTTTPSLGSSSGLFSLQKRSWSPRSVAVCDMDLSVFPPVYESGTLVGEVTSEAAAETGLLAGTPVYTSGGDTMLACLGVGTTDPYAYTVVGGSFWQTTMITPAPLIDPKIRLRTHCHILPGFWMTEGFGFLNGMAVRWFRDAFCQHEMAEAEKLGISAYEFLEREAATVPPGSHGIIATFSDIMNARTMKHATPSFLGFDIFSPETSGKKECYRSLLENAAYVAYGHALILEELTGQMCEEATFCGGASRGILWPQIVTDVTGARLRIPEVKEATALGAAMCVLKGLGVYGGFAETARTIVRWEREVEPNQERHQRYRELFTHWKSVYREVLELGNRGLLEYLWKAPGL
ncbi:MAG TPA: autoinducer-2 kinase [Atribacteraceae bacterium]|nr:autoinducer-2 kinase [Atribacteraceae bacterium]